MTATPIHTLEYRPDVVEILFPSLGFFGGTIVDYLTIEVPKAVRSVRLSLEDESASYLNLRGMELRYRGRLVTPVDREVSISQSSLQGGLAARGGWSLLRKKGIHTAKELNPCWEIRFDKPILIDELRLFNRTDGWGKRSRQIAVDVEYAVGLGGERLYHFDASQSAARVLDTIRSVAGLTLKVPIEQGVDSSLRLREWLIGLLANGLRAGVLGANSKDWNVLIGILPVWRSAEPTRDEWKLIGSMLVAQKNESPNCSTNIAAFSFLLNSRQRLQRLQQELDDIRSASGQPPLMITRHGVRPLGMLKSNKEQYIEGMRNIMEKMSALGYTPMLAYGTLLGAVREGGFLGHDDDVDLLYRTDAKSRDDAGRAVLALARQMAAAGYTVRDLLPRHLNLHIRDPLTGVDLDVFPYWRAGDNYRLHMAKMVVDKVPCHLLEPVSTVVLEGQKFCAPANPEGFLKARYGDGWSISDPYYDWPWKLID